MSFITRLLSCFDVPDGQVGELAVVRRVPTHPVNFSLVGSGVQLSSLHNVGTVVDYIYYTSKQPVKKVSFSHVIIVMK